MNSSEINEFDKNEWWDVCRELQPTLTRTEYERLWAEFQEFKRKKALQ